MKRLTALLFALTMLLCFTACKDNTNETEPTVITAESTEPTTEPVTEEPSQSTASTEEPYTEPVIVTEGLQNAHEQIANMVENRLLWLNEDELYGFMYNFAVADMDGNGRLELYFGSCEGTGHFTFVDCWELSEDLSCLEAVQKDYPLEYSQADMIRGEADVYYDLQTGCFYYIFTDENRNGWAWQGSELRAWSLCEGLISEEALGSYNCETDENYVTVEYYLDAQGREITQEEYEALQEQRFAGMYPMRAKILWHAIDIEEFDALTDEVLTDLLLQSAESFALERG